MLAELEEKVWTLTYAYSVRQKRATNHDQVIANIRETTLPKLKTCKTWNPTKRMVRSLDLKVTDDREFHRQVVPQRKMNR